MTLRTANLNTLPSPAQHAPVIRLRHMALYRCVLIWLIDWIKLQWLHKRQQYSIIKAPAVGAAWERVGKLLVSSVTPIRSTGDAYPTGEQLSWLGDTSLHPRLRNFYINTRARAGSRDVTIQLVSGWRHIVGVGGFRRAFRNFITLSRYNNDNLTPCGGGQCRYLIQQTLPFACQAAATLSIRFGYNRAIRQAMSSTTWQTFVAVRIARLTTVSLSLSLSSKILFWKERDLQARV